MKNATIPLLWINENVKIPVLLFDSNDNPVTGISYQSALSVRYTRDGDAGALQTFTPANSNDWNERGKGIYALALPGTVINQNGLFALAVDVSGYSYRGVGAIDTRVETRLLTAPVTGYQTLSAGAQLFNVDYYKAYANPQFNYVTGTLDFTVWLEKNGVVITTPTSCNVVLTETNGGLVVANLSSALPNSNGVFYLSLTGVTLNPNKNYSIIARVTYNGTNYISADAAQGLN